MDMILLRVFGGELGCRFGVERGEGEKDSVLWRRLCSSSFGRWRGIGYTFFRGGCVGGFLVDLCACVYFLLSGWRGCDFRVCWGL